ncbi:hypothetical protein [Shouchella clausii]|uniref:hypothetical protein n=1 Tax=Shouchella clausii TaxID=79880 RepID=UPI00311DE232
MNRIKQFSAICLIGLVLTGCGMDRINNGEPVKGFVDEFNETIRRIFPNAK